ncbi:hypothetical protein RUND412_009413 [Rhizina undulata]
MSYCEEMEQTDLIELVQCLSRQNPAESVDSIDLTKCCCGRWGCHYLMKTQNMAAIAELERDVYNAATLGQAILRNHGSTMADWERERRSMPIEIANSKSIIRVLQLENSRIIIENRPLPKTRAFIRNSQFYSHNSGLELKNAGTIAENKNLLAKVESLNDSASRGENRVRELQNDLDLVHAELARVSAQETQTETPDTNNANIESELKDPPNLPPTSKEEERLAIPQSENDGRTTAELEQLTERMERERELEKASLKSALEKLRLLEGENTAHRAEHLRRYRAMAALTAEIGELVEALKKVVDALLSK